jgi:hypothetical protein
LYFGFCVEQFPFIGRNFIFVFTPYLRDQKYFVTIHCPFNPCSVSESFNFTAGHFFSERVSPEFDPETLREHET